MAKATNQMILADAFRNGSTGYQQNAPDPSQSTMAESVEFLFNPVNKRWLNEFVSYLYNVFGTTFTRVREFNSPFNRFKRPWSMGDKALEYNLAFLETHAYKDDWDATDVNNLLKVYRPNGESVIHEVNFSDTTPVSYNDVELRRAFDSETGLSDYISAVTALPRNTDEMLNFERVKHLFSAFEVYHGFYKVQLSARPTTKETGEEFATAMQTIAGQLRFPSAQFNARDVQTPVWINPDDEEFELILITTPDVAANINVKTLANLYHDERAEIKFDTLLVDELPIPDAVGLLIMRDWLVMWDQYYGMESWRNPQTMTTTAWLHHIGCISASPFMAAILFTTAEGTVNPEITQEVTGFTLSAAAETVEPGGKVALEPALEGTITAVPEGSDKVIGADIVVPQSSAVYDLAYAPAGADDKYQLDIRTYVDRFNVLHVSKDATVGGRITITAKSTYINPDGQTPTDLVAETTVTIADSAE